MSRPALEGLTREESLPLVVRIRHDDLAVLEKAARRLGLHRATFIRMAAIERAREVLGKNGAKK